MTTSKWILFIVFAICSAGAVCVCPYVMHHAESAKARRIAERLQSFFGGIVVGVLTSILYQTLSK